MNSGKLQNESATEIPNGSAAAAIFSAGVGCFLVSLFALAGDYSPSAAHFFIFYKPTGPLSGVTTSAIVIWLILWAILARCWRRRAIAMGKINAFALLLLVIGLLLSFPPIADFLQGK
jgi:hypothetical protein